MSNNADHDGFDDHQPASNPDSQNVREEWDAIMVRCQDLLPHFRELNLRRSAKEVASALGYDGTAGLRKSLQARRLPPFPLLRDWIYLTLLVNKAERGESLSHFAMSHGRYATVYYRFVSRITGVSWCMLLQRGSGWVMSRALLHWRPYTSDQEL